MPELCSSSGGSGLAGARAIYPKFTRRNGVDCWLQYARFDADFGAGGLQERWYRAVGPHGRPAPMRLRHRPVRSVVDQPGYFTLSVVIARLRNEGEAIQPASATLRLGPSERARWMSDVAFGSVAASLRSSQSQVGVMAHAH